MQKTINKSKRKLLHVRARLEYINFFSAGSRAALPLLKKSGVIYKLSKRACLPLIPNRLNHIHDWWFAYVGKVCFYLFPTFETNKFYSCCALLTRFKLIGSYRPMVWIEFYRASNFTALLFLSNCFSLMINRFNKRFTGFSVNLIRKNFSFDLINLLFYRNFLILLLLLTC